MSSGRVLLALETSSSVASVAVAVGGEPRAAGWLTRSGEHAARLLPRIESTLGEAGVRRREIDGVVFGRGPGSFTGIRIGAATAMGLARGLDVPLYPRSSLKAAAVPGDGPFPGSLLEAASWLDASATDPGAPQYVLFDARSDRVYAGCYRVLAERIVTIVKPTASTIGEVLAGPIPKGARFCGDGALRSASLILEAGYALLPLPYGFPTAEGLLRLHALSGGKPPEAGRAFEPEYLRSPVAFPSGSGPARDPG